MLGLRATKKGFLDSWVLEPRNWTEKGREEQKQEQFIEKNASPREERESVAASGAQLQSRGP